VTQRRLRPRAAALLAGGAYGVHQLRYVLGYGDHSHAELADQGHAYMTLLAPVLAVALVALAADFGARVVRARMGDGPPPSLRLGHEWALATGCLLVAYAAQELVEGALVAGHPAGAAAVVGHGGWVAVPLAAAIGLALALLARGAQGALALAAEPALGVARPRVVLCLRPRRRVRSVFIRAVARTSSARAPPPAAA
jgi:hypothetical protein